MNSKFFHTHSESIQKCILGITVLVILGIALVGIQGNPTSSDLVRSPWKGEGVFELSPERGRFALTYALVENGTPYLTRELARFSSPDVGIQNGTYVSIFAPLVSVLIIPGYLIGKAFGLSQVGSVVIIALFAWINTMLIRSLSIKIGARPSAATIAAIVFICASPAFPYAVNLYQHHISTFLILASLYLYITSQSAVSAAGIFIMCGLSIPLDYPNAFMMFPIGLATLGKSISLESVSKNIHMHIRLSIVGALSVIFIPLGIFMLYNSYTYGGPLKLSGTVQTVTFDEREEATKQDLTTVPINTNVKDAVREDGTRSAVGFFQTRLILNGLYTHFVSPDRGILFFSPIMIMGIIGLIVAIKKAVPPVSLIAAVIGVNVILYSMWGDPWGGWAFGSRYLIPTYALLSIMFGYVLTLYRHKLILVGASLVLINYSIAVNTLGALTIIAIPPKIQVLELEKISGIVQKYSFDRSYEYLITNGSHSYVYNTFLQSYISPTQLYSILVLSLMILVAICTYQLMYSSSSKK